MLVEPLSALKPTETDPDSRGQDFRKLSRRVFLEAWEFLLLAVFHFFPFKIGVGWPLQYVTRVFIALFSTESKKYKYSRILPYEHGVVL